MKIGYPCINRGIGCSANRTFRLASYTENRLLATVRENLECLERILTFNRASGLLFFRITSDLVPLASHPVCTADWQGELRPLFSRVGDLARAGEFRISLHPDQFVLINSPDPGLVQRSVAELEYHAAVLDLMGLDSTARIQIHIGGVYGDLKGPALPATHPRWGYVLPRRVRRMGGSLTGSLPCRDILIPGEGSVPDCGIPPPCREGLRKVFPFRPDRYSE